MKQFEKPMMTIEELTIEDVITTSVECGEDNNCPEGGEF